MCGIAGFVNRHGRPADAELLRAMTDVLAHRGPDGDGHYVTGPVALGHRRLAIIDLVTGAQPMGSEDGTLWITYNGEVYNFAELRRGAGLFVPDHVGHRSHPARLGGVRPGLCRTASRHVRVRHLGRPQG